MPSQRLKQVGLRIRNWLESPQFRSIASRVLPNASRGDWVVFCLAVLGTLYCIWFLSTNPLPASLEDLSKLADGTKRKYREFLAPGLWYGTLAHLIAWSPLVLFARFWPKGAGAQFDIPRSPSPSRPPLSAGRFGIILTLIVLASGVVRWQRMDLSYWGDEGWAVTRYSHGVYRPTDRSVPQGTMRFMPSHWDQAFFDDTTGGNHYLFTVVQRLTLDTWRAVTGKPREAFDETVSRLPSFFSGLACLLILAGMLRWWGRSRTGLWAAFFLAAHPMHLRYSSEARGYSLMLCYLLAVIWFAALALRSGRWRWWLFFGLAEFLAFYSWKGVYYGLAAVNLVVLMMICCGKFTPGTEQNRHARFVAVGRWLAVSLLAGGLLAHLVMPCLLQAPEAITRAGGRPMDYSWLQNTTSLIFTGAPWHIDPESPALVGTRRLLRVYPGISWSLIVLLGVLLVAGGLVLTVRRRPLALLCFALLISCVAGALDFKFRIHAEWQSWYSFYVLPTICTILAFGANALTQLTRERLPRSGPWLTGTAIAGAFVLMVTPLTVYMMSYPFEANREAFEVTRGKHEPLGYKEPSNIFTVYLWRHIDLYDPRADTHTRDAAALRAKIEEVRRAHGDLYVVMGERELSKLLSGDMVAMLEDESLFTHEETFPSLDPALTLSVYHYTGPK